MKKLLLPVFLVVALSVGALVAPLSATDALSPVLSQDDNSKGDCQVGNLNLPTTDYVPDIFQGHEEYAFHILPMEQCGCPNEGFRLEAVNQLLFLDAMELPANIQVQALMLEAIDVSGNGCWVPGAPIYESMISDIIISDNGMVQIQVPTPDSPDFLMGQHYFIALRYLGDMPAYLVVDEEPLACTEYYNPGSGWVDMFELGKTTYGKVIVWGDVVCSEPSVDIEPSTWSTIKSLYR